ncbi:MAG: AAA family ATPase [Chitinophagaceae bacterium]|nr:AAA family ATPase [Chitinophagaceae bacterium]
MHDLVLKTLGIKNFRSIGSEGIMLEGLNKINLLVGKNNSGKSNILKFLNILYSLGGAFGSFPNTIENQHNQTNYPPAISFKYSLDDLDFPEDFKKPSLDGQLNNCKIKDYLNDPVIFEFTFANNKFDIILNKNDIVWDQLKTYEDYIAQAIINKKDISITGPRPWDILKKYYQSQFEKQLKEISSKVIYIPDIRILKQGNNIEKSNSKFNGSNLTSEISLMINHDVGEEEKRSRLDSIEQRVAELLNVGKIKIDVPENNKRIVLVVDKKRFPLENYGTGIHDLVLLCCILILNEKSLVCIEEPEIHLHPEIQRRFIKFLSETEHQYLITTHSNVLLDSLNTFSSIYHVSYDNTKSQIKKAIASDQTRKIIDELGFKASDLLQTNGIIWVEGPSDRTYINRWISLISQDFTEGIHYTIMFYGGKLLSHLSFDDNQEELIEMMKINQNAFIVIDRDNNPLAKTKERVRREIGIENNWVTKGREIENYISLKVINEWLLKNNMNPINKDDIDPKKKIEIMISKYNSNIRYEKKKSVYSKEISECFTEDDLNYLDLKLRMEDLINVIEKWNPK